MPLQLTAREDVFGRECLAVDLSGIVPDRLRDTPAADAARSAIRADGRAWVLGDAFRVSGCCDDGRIEVRGDISRVHHVAAGMQSGDMYVDGAVGRHAGEQMRGGRLTIRGSAGDWLACGMQGGVIHVLGSAGDNTAAALPRHERGVDGGTVLIEGSAGRLAGTRMRRGLLAIGGDCGEAAGYEMWAGTVLVAGHLGPRAGAGMRRGSVIALGPPPEIWPTFSRGSIWQPPVLSMLLNWAVRHGWQSPATTASGPWQQWHGDLLTGGRGELFCRPSA